LNVFRPLIGEERFARLETSAKLSQALLAGSVVWNVSSTATGGGVAEMLHEMVGYIRAAGVDARWLVMDGNPEFFAITKRIHNRIHGMPGDAGSLGDKEALTYSAVSTANVEAFRHLVRPGDVVLLHDPQTAGMASSLREAGAMVIWRSHVGSDTSNAWTREAWEFLQPHLAGTCDAFVFSRAAYVPDWVPAGLVSIIRPSIDPFCPKNQPLPPGDLPLFLKRMGLLSGEAERPVRYRRSDGTVGTLRRRASVVGSGPLTASSGNLVVQVSRWDRLKDMAGVMTGFASRVVGRVDAQLLLVGPAVDHVADDPEGADVLEE
jgi:trehalose synthase